MRENWQWTGAGMSAYRMEAEQWSRPLQVVATQLQLCHCMHCAGHSTSGPCEYRSHQHQGTEASTGMCSPFRAKNFTEGPSGVLASQRYKSCFFRASKNTTLPQPCMKYRGEKKTLLRICKCVEDDTLGVSTGVWLAAGSHTFMSATSLMTPLSVFVSSLASFLQCGNSCIRSSMRCLCLHPKGEPVRLM